MIRPRGARGTGLRAIGPSPQKGGEVSPLSGLVGSGDLDPNISREHEPERSPVGAPTRARPKQQRVGYEPGERRAILDTVSDLLASFGDHSQLSRRPRPRWIVRAGAASLLVPEAPHVSQQRTIRVSVNGVRHERTVEVRRLLSDFLRHDLLLTGTHVGCEHGSCGACTVLLDGASVRSCLIFAVQADGCELTTVEGLANGHDLHPLQAAFRDAHGLQCGFCTPGILMTLIPFLNENPRPSEREVREAISGNLCRCTGYENIVRSVILAAERAQEGAADVAHVVEAGRAASGERGGR